MARRFKTFQRENYEIFKDRVLLSRLGRSDLIVVFHYTSLSFPQALGRPNYEFY